MTVETRPGLVSGVETKQTQIGEDIYPNGIGLENGDGRLPADLIEHNGFIAVKATFESDQPLDGVRKDLINRGVGDLRTQLRVIRRVVSARNEISQAKKISAKRPSSD